MARKCALPSERRLGGIRSSWNDQIRSGRLGSRSDKSPRTRTHQEQIQGVRSMDWLPPHGELEKLQFISRCADRLRAGHGR